MKAIEYVDKYFGDQGDKRTQVFRVCEALTDEMRGISKARSISSDVGAARLFREFVEKADKIALLVGVPPFFLSFVEGRNPRLVQAYRDLEATPRQTQQTRVPKITVTMGHGVPVPVSLVDALERFLSCGLLALISRDMCEGPKDGMNKDRKGG